MTGPFTSKESLEMWSGFELTVSKRPHAPGSHKACGKSRQDVKLQLRFLAYAQLSWKLSWPSPATALAGHAASFWEDVGAIDQHRSQEHVLGSVCPPTLPSSLLNSYFSPM